MTSWTHYHKLALCLIVMLLTISGCIAVWGAAHKVVSADQNGITVQYDPSSTSSLRAQILARDHCEKFGKKSRPVSSRMAPYPGIIEETYDCVEAD